MKACFLGVVVVGKVIDQHLLRRAIKFDLKSHESSTGCECSHKFNPMCNRIEKFFYFIRSLRIAVNVEPRRTNNSQIGMHKLHGMNRHVFRDIWRLIRKARVPLKSVTGKAMRINDIYRETGELRKCQEIIATWRWIKRSCGAIDASPLIAKYEPLASILVLHFMSTSGRSRRVKRSWSGNFMGNLISTFCALWEMPYEVISSSMRVKCGPPFSRGLN